MIEFFVELWADFQKCFLSDNMWLMYLKGLRNTLFISIGACLLGLLIGIVVTCIRIAPKTHPAVKVLDKICGVYVTVIRGTPVVLPTINTRKEEKTSPHDYEIIGKDWWEY